MHVMDKSEEFFEDTVDPTDNSTKAAAIRDLLTRLKTIASCFRTGFPELARSANNSAFNNDSNWWGTDYSTWNEDEGDTLIHTIVVVTMICCVGLLLVIRSSRGGSCTSCKAGDPPVGPALTGPATSASPADKSAYKAVPT
ncbi:hypothetical protein BV898_09448 [Hypsibius exemplaris]|uniref:Uncharacterized protein n=1 Tax=Hypsibius exemplaris TaxID=2072580 RepID=A0A1W0WMN2_HYPEX|nr:hypothetical protein BV898_09448 [Hypsibius exemplaris]